MRVDTPQIAWPAAQERTGCQEPKLVPAASVVQLPFFATRFTLLAAVSSSTPTGASTFICPPTNALLTSDGFVTPRARQVPQFDCPEVTNPAEAPVVRL